MKRKKLFLILGIALVCLAVGGYFIIDHMLNQDLQKQQQELDELANMQAATKSGEAVEMELFSFADGRFFLKLPKSFAPMDESLIAVKYPSGNAPTHVFTNEQTTINVALNITENNMSDDEIAQYIKYMEQELENILNYIHIQQYRFQDRFVFRIYPHAKKEFYAACKIPKMTLQPIVENAIFNGMEQKVKKGHISIHIEADGEKLIILVDDDGVGMDEEILEKINQKLRQADGISNLPPKSKHNGIAMENVNSRLKLLYGSDYGLRISSTKGLGTEVEITLPKLLPEDCQEEI